MQPAKELNTAGRSYEVTLGQAETKYVELIVDMEIAYDQQCEKTGNWKADLKTREKMLNALGAQLAFCKIFNLVASIETGKKTLPNLFALMAGDLQFKPKGGLYAGKNNLRR